MVLGKLIGMAVAVEHARYPADAAGMVLARAAWQGKPYDELAEVADAWDERFREYGAHETRADGSLAPAAEAYRASLPPATDFEACQYLGDAGCRLPRESRPGVCLSFQCDRLWDARVAAGEI